MKEPAYADAAQIEQTAAAAAKIAVSVGQAFIGKPDIIELLVTALFAGGHVLLEDVPGTGKTILAKALAKTIGADFSRIQCTPDLMPADITGTSIWSPKTLTFKFRRGPLIAPVVLVDELNRATPRTQAALLEAMAEGQVSVDGRQHRLPDSFFLMATENPVDSEGTFPLPEAQKDRFMMALSIGYPSPDDEARIIESQRRTDNPVEDIAQQISADTILKARQTVVTVHVDEAVLSYILALSAGTRQDTRIALGISPRGSIALYKAVQALAAVRGRSYAIPEDVKELILPVFRKRLIIKPETLLHGYTPDTLISELLHHIPIPAYKEKQS
jgi:MoxR-like ATPase